MRPTILVGQATGKTRQGLVCKDISWDCKRNKGRRNSMAAQAAQKKKDQLPIKLRTGGKTDVRTQFAALCYRTNKKGKLRICIVTSRRSKRWILPKGWPMHNMTPARAAATEAWEEAGVKGRAIDQCLGVYSYVKPLTRGAAPVIVMVYPLAVTKIAKNWPEDSQRKRKWLSLKKAARALTEPELRRIVRRFDPAKLGES